MKSQNCKSQLSHLKNKKYGKDIQAVVRSWRINLIQIQILGTNDLNITWLCDFRKVSVIQILGTNDLIITWLCDFRKVSV